MDRYQLLIDLGEEQGSAPRQRKDGTKTLIDGCQSRVWLVCDENNGILTFRAESDAPNRKGSCVAALSAW